MRLILIILFIYALITFIMRQVVPSLMRKYVNDFQKNFNENQKHTNESGNQKKEGEISITYMNQDKNKTINPDDADYVDYEEIK